MNRHPSRRARMALAAGVLANSLTACAHEPPALAPISPDHHRLYGAAIDDNTIDYPAEPELLRLIVNHDDGHEGYKVGAEIDLCRAFALSDETDCTTVRYYFPELTYDPVTRDVKWGDEVIEHRGNWAWTHWMSSHYRLGYTESSVKRSDGFDSHSTRVVSVYLEPRDDRATAAR